MKRIVFVAIATSFLFACSEYEPVYTGKKFQIFDSIPTNLSDVNSEFDDYNSAYPPGTWGLEHELTFSSNRNSNGENFDFVSYYLMIFSSNRPGGQGGFDLYYAGVFK